VRIPWNWLRECVELPCSPEELAERLTDSGTEVEAIERIGGRAEGIRVARVDALEPHPTRSNLRVARLDLGGGQGATAVTAASNVRVGDRVPYGPPGARLADGTELGLRDFDGLRSAGMMLSAEELGQPDAADEFGILILDGEARPGEDALRAYGLDDPVLDLSVTPNRGDLWSVLGVAREAYALVPGARLIPPLLTPPTGPEDWPFAFEGVELEDPGCPAYTLGCAWDVSVRPAPLRERIRLAASGIRPIDGIVDATNWVMLFWGQPLHAFDADRLASPRIVVRAAREGEALETLDHKERCLTPQDMVITTGEHPIGLAGVMGGLESEIVPETRRIVLESAVFDPARICFTSRRFGLNSQASARFARGIDPLRSVPAAYDCLSKFAAWCGARVSCRVLHQTSAPFVPGTAFLRTRSLERVLRYDDLSGASAILSRLGFDRTDGGEDPGRAVFRIPSWRGDVEMEMDLVEEVGRVRGYNDVPSRLAPFLREPGEITEPVRALADLRTVALGRGFTEVVTYSFLAPSDLEGLRLPADDPRARAVPIVNPISAEQSVMRTFLLPGLLKALRGNLRRGRRATQRIFESGRVFLSEGEDVREPEHFAAILAEGRTKVLWPDRESESFFSLKADLEAILASRGRTALFSPAREPFAALGQTASVEVDGARIGWIGRIKPSLCREMDLPGGIWAFEIDLALLFEPVRRTYGRTWRFPASYRDVALLAPVEVSAAEVEERIRAFGGPLLQAVELFDVYAGKGLPEGKRSLAFSLAFRHPDRTLSDEEVSEADSALRKGLADCGFVLR
jgi:phenylalanyl-tRNA synthetase beta chain